MKKLLKARTYMKLYKTMESLDIDSLDMNDKFQVNKHSVMEGAIKLYSKLRKKSKTLRSVLDMNLSDVIEIENLSNSEINTIAKSKDSVTIKRELIGALWKKMVVS